MALVMHDSKAIVPASGLILAPDPTWHTFCGLLIQKGGLGRGDSTHHALAITPRNRADGEALANAIEDYLSDIEVPIEGLAACLTCQRASERQTALAVLARDTTGER